jgi:hypothetical protein
MRADAPFGGVETAPIRIRRRFFYAFAAINALLSVVLLDHALTPNPSSRALAVLSLVERHSFAIDGREHNTPDVAQVGAHFYSDKAPLPALVVAPLYALYRALGPPPPASLEGRAAIVVGIGGFVCGTLPFLVILFLTFASSTSTPQLPSPVLVMLATYGSFLFAYSGTFFSHVLAAMFLLVAHVRLARASSAFWPGFLVGLAFLSEHPMGLAAPLWAVQLSLFQRNLRRSLLFGVGFLPAVVAMGIYNHALTGHALQFLYSNVADQNFVAMRHFLGFAPPSPGAAFGLLFSLRRGMFVFAPVLLVWAWVAFRCRAAWSWRDALRNRAVGFAIASFLLVASYYMWWGGWCYGPRHLVPAFTLLTFEAARWLARRGVPRLTFWLAGSLGLLMMWAARITVGIFFPDNFDNPMVELVGPRLAAGALNAGNIATWFWGVPPLVVSLAWLLAFALALVGLGAWQRRIEAAGSREAT